MTLDLFFARLEQLRRSFEHCGTQHTCSLFDASWEGGIAALERMVFAYRGTDVEQMFVADPRFEVYAKYFREVSYQWEIAYEYQEQQKTIARLEARQAHVLEDTLPAARTFPYAAKECSSLTDGSSFIHVGSGPYPESILGVRQITKEQGISCSILALDRDAQAMEKAEYLFRLTDLQDEIQTRVLSAEAMDFSAFSHILLAIMVRPDYFAVQHIVETASTTKPVEILLRTVSGLAELIYEPISKASICLLEQAGFVFSHEVTGSTIMKTLVYRRG